MTKRRMAPSEERVREMSIDDWRLLSTGLLVGLVAVSLLFTLLIAIDPPSGAGLSALSLFLVTACVGVVAVPLRWFGVVGGDELSLLAGLIGLGTVGIVGMATSGTASVATTPVTLAVYGLLAAAVLTTTYLAQPEPRSVTGASDGGRPRLRFD